MKLSRNHEVVPLYLYLTAGPPILGFFQGSRSVAPQGLGTPLEAPRLRNRVKIAARLSVPFLPQSLNLRGIAAFIHLPGAMPRVKRTHIARTISAFVVICLFFMNFTPWRSTSRDAFHPGDSSDVLSYVNMFIGTTNGGEDFAPN